MELFEGNEGFNFDTESYWGNSTYGTVFRNHWTGLRRSASPLQLSDTGNRRAVGVQTGGVVVLASSGNVLGFPGMPLRRRARGASSTQADVNNLNDDGAVPMWNIGYEDGHLAQRRRTRSCVARTYRHGNFDYVTNAVAWDPSNSNHTLPPSLYLTRKPAFFGDQPLAVGRAHRRAPTRPGWACSRPRRASTPSTAPDRPAHLGRSAPRAAPRRDACRAFSSAVARCLPWSRQAHW